MANYSVNLWCSNPDLGNDDCVSGDDFNSYEEAQKVFYNPESHFEGWILEGVRFVQFLGESEEHGNEYEVREVEGFVNYDDNDDWEREMALEAGMLLGVDAYNDHMGY